MKYDEFAFFNQQLASMLKDGIPLEGAIKQLCAHMRRGRLRAELEALGSDLSAGVPLDRALEGRHLPELYVRMLQVGVKSNNLPGVLLLVADHYHNRQLIWTRLKGLMVYPALVLLASFCVSFLLAVILLPAIEQTLGESSEMSFFFGEARLAATMKLLAPPILLGFFLLVVVTVCCVPAIRRWLEWVVPPFKTGNCARTASALAMLLRAGCPLPDAVGLLGELERGTPASREFQRWLAGLEAGCTDMGEIAVPGSVFPSLFVWLISNSGEDLADGFDHAGDVFRQRAAYQVDVFLYCALPASVVVLGALILMQAHAVFALITQLMGAFGHAGL